MQTNANSWATKLTSRGLPLSVSNSKTTNYLFVAFITDVLSAKLEKGDSGAPKISER